jgi:lipoprotein NlpI
MALLVLLSGCATTTPTQTAMSNIIIAEPLPISYKSEIALARLSEVIQRADISEQQRAKLFYDRGVIYDSVGLKSLARLDFTRAIRLQPDFAMAYNFLGVELTQIQEFSQAYEAFDSALEIDSAQEFAYLNRGIALYYGGRPQLAVNDLKQFYQYQPNDPYRILWLYFAEAAVDTVQAKQALIKRAKAVDDDIWAKQIILLFADKISVNQLLQTLPQAVVSNEKLTDRLCEAYFYLAKYYLMQQQVSVASNYFKLALGTNVYEFVEHRYARLELDLLSDKQKGNVEPN